LTDFQRGHIVGARLAAVSVIATATLLGISRAPGTGREGPEGK